MGGKRSFVDGHLTQASLERSLLILRRPALRYPDLTPFTQRTLASRQYLPLTESLAPWEGTPC